MTTVNDSENSENLEALNAEIRQILIEVLPIISPELQVEIANLVNQVHHINYLINKKNKHWLIGKIKTNNESTKYTLLLEEIKNILLISKVESEMCNRPRLVIDYQIDYHFFLSNRNRNRAFLQNSNRNRNRNPVKKKSCMTITSDRKF